MVHSSCGMLLCYQYRHGYEYAEDCREKGASAECGLLVDAVAWNFWLCLYCPALPDLVLRKQNEDLLALLLRQSGEKEE